MTEVFFHSGGNPDIPPRMYELADLALLSDLITSMFDSNPAIHVILPVPTEAPNRLQFFCMGDADARA